MTNNKPEVDLEKLIDDLNQNKMEFTRSFIRDAMREACRQLLDIVAENGKAKKDTYVLLNGKRNATYARVDKQSILDCIQYVK